MKLFDFRRSNFLKIYLLTAALVYLNFISAETNHANYILTRKGMSSLSNTHLKVAGVEVILFTIYKWIYWNFHLSWTNNIGSYGFCCTSQFHRGNSSFWREYRQHVWLVIIRPFKHDVGLFIIQLHMIIVF